VTRPYLDPKFAASEISAKLVFSGTRLDRLAENRKEDCIAQALNHPDAKLMGFARGRVVVSFDDDGIARGLFSVEELEQFAPKNDKMALLGFDQGAPRLAVPLGFNPDDEGFSLPAPYKAIDYRSLARQSLLDHENMGILAHGGALLAWHATNRFCAKCGQPSEAKDGGAKRVCPSCTKEHFPRTDPVVIMLTVSGDKCLLGRSHHFPAGFYSALAGFVEQGETMENAVRRETFEESGIRVGDVRYHASQPWPFPHTLMIGCYSEALDDTIDMDAAELDDCRWFTRDELKAIIAGDGPKNEDGSPAVFLPPTMAIASRLLTDWVAEG